MSCNVWLNQEMSIIKIIHIDWDIWHKIIDTCNNDDSDECTIGIDDDYDNNYLVYSAVLLMMMMIINCSVFSLF